MRKVAIQGIIGSFHDIAARQYFQDETLAIIECMTFKRLIEEIKEDPTVIGVMAIENTIAGSLLQNYDLIRNSGHQIIGEKKLRISHSLVAHPGTRLEEITEVNSHPIALLQCCDFLERMPQAKIVEKEDTALSAKWIASEQLTDHAAICHKQAAADYGLAVLAEGIETNKRNFTRFLIIADADYAKQQQEKLIRNKSSLVFSLPHASGSLSKILSILSFYDMNLTKIQSLPIIGREWEYQFYIDLTFEDYIRYKQTIDAIVPLTKELKILGEYAEE